MLHLANEERVESGDFQMPLLQRFDIAEMDRHSRAILGRLGKVRLKRALKINSKFICLGIT
jgi:hypothetical protein